MAKVKKAKAVKKLGATKQPKLGYHLEVEVNGNVYKGDAVSLEQALTDFVNNPAFPQGAKTKALVRFSKGDVERYQVWQPFKARRLFNQISLKPTSLEILAGQLNQFLL